MFSSQTTFEPSLTFPSSPSLPPYLEPDDQPQLCPNRPVTDVISSLNGTTPHRKVTLHLTYMVSVTGPLHTRPKC